MPETIGILVANSANRKLISEFCTERGLAVRAEGAPHSFDIRVWEDIDLFLVDELFASRHGKALLALKQRRPPGIFLPVLVLVEPRSPAADWLEAGFDDLLRMPISKAELGARLAAFLQLRRQSIEIARRGEAMFRAIVDQSLVGVYLFTGDTFLYVNQAFAEMTGYDAGEIVGKMNPLDLVDPEDKPLVSAQIAARLSGKVESARYRLRAVRQDGTTAYWEAFGRHIDYQGQPAVLGTVIDITEQVRAEQRLQQVMRALRVLSTCNQAIVRASDESVLLQDICEILVAQGGYRLAWVGMAAQDEARNVRVVAKAGPAVAFLDEIHVSWKEDKWGRGPTGTAIRTGEPQLN
ncbi:MAG: PAS domain S-box protein, partial [Anaerolineae bacterium]